MHTYVHTHMYTYILFIQAKTWNDDLTWFPFFPQGKQKPAVGAAGFCERRNKGAANMCMKSVIELLELRRHLQDALESLPEEVIEEASQAPSFEGGSLVLI